MNSQEEVAGLSDLVAGSDINVTRVNGIWVTGTYKNLDFQAKVYDEPSKYGVKKRGQRVGRVSKLVAKLIGTNWNEEVLSYDRGWCVRPKTEEAKELLEIMFTLKPMLNLQVIL